MILFLPEANTTQAGLLGADKWDEIVANSLKVSDIDHNVSTNLSVGTITGTTVDVNSSDGTNATLPEATTTDAGVLSAAKWDEIVANTAKVDTNIAHNNLTLDAVRTLTVDGTNHLLIDGTTTSNTLRVQGNHTSSEVVKITNVTASGGAAMTLTADSGTENTLKVTNTRAGGGAINAIAESGGVAGSFVTKSASTSSPINVLNVQRLLTTGTAINGLGAFITYSVENDAGSSIQSAKLHTRLSEVGAGVEVADFSIDLINGAGALNTDILKLKGDTGAVSFNYYGSGTHTGTEVYALTVDSSGNIIESSYSGVDTNLGNTNQVIAAARTIDLSGNTLDITEDNAVVNTVFHF